ncbi:hypothetical protein BCR35DRAFT_302978 [Leucosporidium creatinivorum]|uniref:L domain-like protein n=1 Tax=Leucosporidium creatinivorum TaxID=106004 RepID=A0A1Y2FN74_9BASI|nr:hypothetical protein BCR35DRAFT_302978 [Leucosporidium creatinivorum]
MAPPSTPTRSRLLPPSTPSRSSSTTPTPRTPAVTRSSAKPSASASPQVKAALAALRAKKKAEQEQQSTSLASSPAEASSSGSPSSAPAAPTPQSNDDPFLTPARPKPKSRSSGASTPGVGKSVARTKGGQEFVLEWGGKSEKKLIEEAKKSGRLNLSSRSLLSIPPRVYSSLLPTSSPYHPSNLSNHSSSSNGAEPDLTFSGSNEEEEEETAWYEQTDLKALVLANNEIQTVEEQVGGFEELVILDIHNNHLISPLPTSLAYLTNLTSLNLSSNRLSSFPLQLLNLASLITLNLSSNDIPSLWSVDWRDELKDSISPPGTGIGSPSQTPESPADGGQAFWDSFPSSPTKLSTNTTVVSAAPFPNLTTLQLASNPLHADSLIAPGFDLPPKLQVFDLSETGLREKGLPLRVLGRLSELRELRLDGCGIGEGLFVEEEAEVEESQLKTDSNPFTSTSKPSPPPFPTSNGASRSSSHDEPPRYFPSLTLLSLAHNALDEIFPLEQFLQTRVRRPVEWIGLEKPILNLMHAEMVQRREEGEEEEPWKGSAGVRVEVRDNVMRWERERRRERLRVRELEKEERRKIGNGEGERLDEEEKAEASINGHADQVEVERKLEGLALEDGGASREKQESSPASPSTESAAEATAHTNGIEPVSSPSSSVAAAIFVEPSTPASPTTEPAPTPEPEALATDTSVILVSSSITTTSTALTLSSRSLTSLPVPSTGTPPSTLRSIASIDLSLNQLEAVPLMALQTWTWAKGLVKLDLRRNRIRGMDFGALRGGGEEALLPNLKTLDLSWNQLESTTTTLLGSSDTNDLVGAPTSTLALLAALAPSLTSLDLSHNRLTTLQGISSLVQPSHSSSGVRTLLLKGNKIEDLEELCEVARELGEDGKSGWTTGELDLSDNEIARLPPILGHLPLTLLLHLLGNRFRIPRQDVYENAQLKLVVPWLRDRL